MAGRSERTAEERLSRLLELQAVLGDVAREIGPAVDLQLVLKTVMGAMRRLCVFRGGTIQLRDESGVYIAAADPDVSQALKDSRVPIGEGLSGRVVAEGRSVYSPDLWHDDRVDKAQAALNEMAHSYLAVPLTVAGETIGVLQIDSTEVDAFDTEDIAILEGLAVQVAGAIESARRYEVEVDLERMKGDFIARISHELRTPLTIMGGFTDTLIQHGHRLDDEKRVEILGRIQSSVGRLSALIEEILTVASFEAGMIEVRPEEVDVRSLLAQVRALSVDPSRVNEGETVDAGLTADPVILRHVLNQLVDNALKYAGTCTMQSQLVDKGRTLEIAVVDDGPGIAPSDAERIFQRFFRGSHTGAGMGLGLSVARALADRLGADLVLRPTAGGGATFAVRFPVD